MDSLNNSGKIQGVGHTGTVDKTCLFIHHILHLHVKSPPLGMIFSIVMRGNVYEKSHLAAILSWTSLKGLGLLLDWCFALQEKPIAASRLFCKKNDNSHQGVSLVHRSLFPGSLTLSSVWSLYSLYSVTLFPTLRCDLSVLQNTNHAYFWCPWCSSFCSEQPIKILSTSQGLACVLSSMRLSQICVLLF